MLKENTQTSAEGDWVSCARCGGEYRPATVDEEGVCRGCVAAHQERIARISKTLVGVFGSEKIAARYRLQSFELEPGNQIAFEAIKQFDPAKDNLYLHGPCGVGKSHLAYGLAIARVFDGQQNIKVVKPTQLVRQLRGRTGEEEDLELRRIIGADLLIVDDLGVESPSDFALRLMYEIVDARELQERNGLVITSNLKLPVFAKRAGDDRLASRIAGLCRGIEITGKDRRGKR